MSTEAARGCEESATLEVKQEERGSVRQARVCAIGMIAEARLLEQLEVAERCREGRLGCARSLRAPSARARCPTAALTLASPGATPWPPALRCPSATAVHCWEGRPRRIPVDGCWTSARARSGGRHGARPLSRAARATQPPGVSKLVSITVAHH